MRDIFSPTQIAPNHDNMVLRIRLARFGNKHTPFYNIVVAQARYVMTIPPFAGLPLAAVPSAVSP